MHAQIRVEPPETAGAQLLLLIFAAGEKSATTVHFCVVHARARLVFVDERDRLQYCNKVDRQQRMAQGKTLGRDIRTCHKTESLPRTEQMLEDLRTGRKDEDEFWIDGLGVKLLNRFLAVRDESGKYLGCVEYLLDFTALEELAKAKADSHRFVSSPTQASDRDGGQA